MSRVPTIFDHEYGHKPEFRAPRRINASFSFTRRLGQEFRKIPAAIWSWFSDCGEQCLAILLRGHQGHIVWIFGIYSVPIQHALEETHQ
jgi:hypothetical protein